MDHFWRRMKYKIVITLFITVLVPCRAELSLAPTAKDVERYVNESYIVTCVDTVPNGPGGPTMLRWYKGKLLLEERGHPYVSNMSTGLALVFERIAADDRGQYTCTSGEEARGFKLIVIAPISFGNTAGTQVAQEHRTVTVRCEVRGDPKPKIQWKFDDKELKPPKYEITSSGLKITNVSLEDKGMYTCRAYQMSDLSSMFEDKHIKLNVQHKPVHRKPVHAKVDQAYGYIGGEVNLTCEAVAEPAANFTWFRPHKKMIVDGRIIQKAHWSIFQLYIRNASIFGDYLCKASNELGTLDQIITLLEGVKPPKPQKVALKGSNSDTLGLVIVGPEVNDTQIPMEMRPKGFRIQYRPKGSKLKWGDASRADFDEAEGGTYVITSLSHNTEYEIRVATRNLAGLSDYTDSVFFRTLKLQADSVTSEAPAAPRALGVLGAFGAVGVLLCVVVS